MEGWITLHRKFLQWEWFDKPEMVQLFIWMLLHANHHDSKWQGIELKRGQLVMTTPIVQKSAKLSEQQIRTCIKRLKSTGEITTKSTNKYTIVTICNYDRYQGDKIESNGQNNKQPNGRATDKQQTNNGQTTDTINNNNITIKQCNNNNNNNNNNISVCNSAHTREDKERDLIFSIFFLKNFINPAAEVDRFYNNYESQGWVRGNGQKITNKIAVAKSWEQEDKGKKRFPEPFIQAMREIAEMPFYDPKIVRGIDRIDLDATILTMYCSDYTRKAIEYNPAARCAIVDKMQRNLRYRVKRTN